MDGGPSSFTLRNSLNVPRGPARPPRFQLALQPAQQHSLGWMLAQERGETFTSVRETLAVSGFH